MGQAPVSMVAVSTAESMIAGARSLEDTMKIGVALPQLQVGKDPVVVRDFVQAAEGIGYDHLAVYDHVVGVNPSSRPDWKGLFTSAHAFHDPFALFGFLAGQTKRSPSRPKF
jgi:alkanesulfonate monooxygenase SsuD/methylene tetrahydromethanopterin reductase-like flavin-dependent oxidoreductase (luciferase family)